MKYVEQDPFGMYKPSLSNGAAHSGPGPALMGADTLIGNDVFNFDNQNLGNIKEIMLDMHSGTIAYAVLDFGGFLGLGNKLFAVPWRILELDPKNKRFVIDVNKDSLLEAPGFNQDQWPDMADIAWQTSVNDFYAKNSSLVE
jgi:sporulation protein YlmC with PRC-barrel domain